MPTHLPYSIFDDSPVAAVLLTPDFKIKHTNLSFQIFFGIIPKGSRLQVGLSELWVIEVRFR